MGTARRMTIVLVLLSALVGMTACASADPAEESSAPPVAEEPGTSGADADTGEDGSGAADVPAWTSLELVDVETGQPFAIADLTGTPVYIQAFAVW